MAHDSDQLDDIPSLVPERDELVSHRTKQRRGSASAAAPVYASEATVSRTSGFVSFVLILLFLGMCGTGAAGYFFYTEGQQSQANLDRALARIGQLESRLSVVDESSVQSSSGLLERVKLNFSEIDKLWAARNQLRTAVESLTSKMAEVEKSSKSMETAISKQASIANENTNQMKTLAQNLERSNQNNNLGTQLTTLNADLTRVKTAMDKVQTDVQTRLSASEQDIESINRFRLQVNQNLSALQESVNRLQQRVGQ
jgi:chromosome segregation ATPase